MNTSEIILFALTCTVSAFFTAVMQTGFFFNFRPFGFAPDLCLALAVVCGLKFGSKCGGIVGLLAGFFLDAFSSQGVSLAVIFYTLVGIAMGILSSPRSEINLPHFLLFLIGTVCSALMSGIATLLEICATHSSVLLSSIVVGSTIPELLSTLVFSLPFYPLAALISNFLKKKQGFYSK
jgi:F0F1-type ATP synthase assembly protein I